MLGNTEKTDGSLGLLLRETLRSSCFLSSQDRSRRDQEPVATFLVPTTLRLLVVAVVLSVLRSDDLWPRTLLVLFRYLPLLVRAAGARVECC